MADADETTDTPGRQPGAFTIARATSAEDVAAVAVLFREYTDSLGIYLTFQNLEAELAGLPGAYGPPGGVLLLARRVVDSAGDGNGNGTAVGCVAVRPLPDYSGASANKRCELKRMYVRAEARGSGLGRALAQRALAEAAAVGGDGDGDGGGGGDDGSYDEMVLDVLASSRAAQRLYESLGFEQTAAYYATPVADTVFYRLALRGGSAVGGR